MFLQQDIQVANATSRINGAVGSKAIVPRKVREYLETYATKDTKILDFGAGKYAAHAQELKTDGYNITAYEFGDIVDPEIHCVTALADKYDVVYASNVLNVQSSVDMTRLTIRQIGEAVNPTGVLFVNYPQKPRKSDISTKEMALLLLEQFTTVERVGGTPYTPLWSCAYQS